MNIGQRVTYEDEPLERPEVIGYVVAPTDIELAYAKKYSDAVGPEYGDIMVQWDEDDPTNRAWHQPTELQELP